MWVSKAMIEPLDYTREEEYLPLVAMHQYGMHALIPQDLHHACNLGEGVDALGGFVR